MTIIATVIVYFIVLMILSHVTARHANNDTFFRANRRSPWYMVAFGMVGASISGITFVSVPGMVLKSDMTYLQTCLGFIVGYFVIAFVLLPVYYRYNLTTIYAFLDRRLGHRSYKTGAAFFLLSKLTGAAARFYVVCIILQRFVLDGTGVPFPVTVIVMVALIWIYTRRGGIKTLVWTDSFQTLCMFGALLLIIYHVCQSLGLSPAEAVKAVAADAHSRMFVFDDWMTTQNFWKQFLSGIFIVVVMTGLDQDMMQKNLTCKSLRDAQKDMCTYGFAFVPANLLFLTLGILLAMLAQKTGTPLPQVGDDLLPMFAATGRMGQAVTVLFTIGIVAASFSSADSALTALTTSLCVDMMEQPEDERLRRKMHITVAAAFVLCIIAFRVVNSSSMIDAIYVLCSYTYGPLLGMFAYSIFTRQKVNDKAVPYIAVASPLLCFALDKTVGYCTDYHFGYELLMLNGLFTFMGMYLSRPRQETKRVP